MRRVFVTGRSIYYVRDDVVTKVADRTTQRATPDHPALGAALAGAFSKGSVYAPTSEQVPHAGQHLCFAGKGGAVISSPVEHVLHVYEAPTERYPDLGFDEDDEASSSYAGR